MNTGERQAMMQSMMDKCLAGMSADEKKDMCATMMGIMTGKGGEGPGDMPDIMSEMMRDSDHRQMPQIMLTTMMPHCIGMMLPVIEPDKRGDVGATIVTAVVEEGSAGMSDEQRQSFLERLTDALNPQP